MYSIFLFLLMFISLPTFATSNPTLEMQNYLLHMRPQEISLDKVKNYIKEGADPKALAITGGNSFNLAVDAFSYITADVASATRARDIAFYLASLGVDTDLPGERELTPLYILLRFGTAGPLMDEMFNFLISKPIDLNRRFARGYGLTGLLSRGNQNKYFLKLIDRGLDIQKERFAGGNFTHLSAGAKVKADRLLLIKTLLEKIPFERREKLLNAKTNDGSTPLHFAAYKGNLEAIKYLVENYKLDIEAVNNDGESVLSIAREFAYSDVVNYLLSRGAKADVMPLKNNCYRANQGDFNFERTVDLIKSCKIKSLDRLLPLLPTKYRSNYTLAYGTLAVQDASPDYPQVIMFGHDGKLLMAFNGHSSQRGYHNLEMIEFKDETKTFEFRDIEFPQNSSGNVKFSKANPIKCLGCHGDRPRPLWDNWVLWSGKYGAEMNTLTAHENKLYKQFEPYRLKGRYKYLLSSYLGPVRTPYGPGTMLDFSNIKLDDIINSLVPQKIAREIVNESRLNKFKYAILGSLSCSKTPVEDFLPKEIKNKFHLNLNSLIENTRQLDSQEMKNRIDLQENFAEFPVTGRYVVQNKYRLEDESYAGRNFEILRTARVRYIVENNRISTSDWASAFNKGKLSFSTLSLSALEEHLWKNYLESEHDEDLLSRYKQASQAQDKDGLPSNLFYETPQESEVCRRLKEKSLVALKE